MEIKEYPANSGAPSSTLPSYSDGVAECDPTSGFLENWKRLDTEFLIALFDAGNSKRLLEQVQKEDFCNSCCGSLFECMQQVASTGPLTSMRVLDALTSAGQETSIGVESSLTLLRRAVTVRTPPYVLLCWCSCRGETV